MLKKILIYIAFVVLGLIGGYIFFNDDTENSVNAPKDEVDQQVQGRWTCSMHPQVEGEKGGTCPLCAMDLVFMDTGETLSDVQFAMNEQALALANVQTTRVGSNRYGNHHIKLSGLISTNKETDAVQTTLFDGRIDKLYTNYVGKKVYKGQQIGLIYSPELYLAQDKLLTSRSYKDTHPKLYNAARNTLGLWKMTDEQIDSMLKSGKPLVNFPLYADVSGTITEITASEGNYYNQGDSLFKTSDLRTVWAILDAYEDQLPFLKLGQQVRLKTIGISETTISGRISFIDPVMDVQKRTTAVRVVINNRKGKLKPGMFVQAAVEIMDSDTRQENLMLVPKSAVLWTGKRSLVYKKSFSDKPIFEIQEVVLGKSMENQYEILQGLDLGDEIVVNGTFTVDASAQLQGKKSMMEYFDEVNKSNHGHSPIHDMDHMMEGKFPVIWGTHLENSFKKLIEEYMVLKDHFIASDFEQVNQSSQNIQMTINDLKKGLSGQKVQDFENFEFHLKKLHGSPDIGAQRKEFKHLSEVMVSMAKKIGDLPTTLYIQHCDCADGFKGASWLSYNEDILNPYFGDAMLTCGRVEKF